MHQFQPKTSPTGLHRGFTLIELLIVVTLLLLLTAMTVVAIDFTFEAERVKSGARQVQSLLTGARDRAIALRQPCGVRFFLEDDDLNGRRVTSMAYIGYTKDENKYWSRGTIVMERIDDVAPFDVADSPEVVIVKGSPDTLWSTLMLRGYMEGFEDLNLNNQLDAGEDTNFDQRLDTRNPMIRFIVDPKKENNRWISVHTHRISPGTNELQIIGDDFPGDISKPFPSVQAHETGRRLKYELRMPPRILPDADLVQLPAGVVIDLDASKVPDAWRPEIGAGYDRPYQKRLDIMFSPQGTVMEGSTGLIHLVLMLREDADLMVRSDFTDRRVPVNLSPTNTAAFDKSRSVMVEGHPNLPADAKVGGDVSLVTIYTRTGKVASPLVDVTDADSDGWADDPFRFAVRGEVTNQ